MVKKSCNFFLNFFESFHGTLTFLIVCHINQTKGCIRYGMTSHSDIFKTKGFEKILFNLRVLRV